MPKGVRNQTSANRTARRGAYTPPSSREHPPAGRGASVGGVHSPGALVKPKKR